MTDWNAPEYARISALQAAMAEEATSLLNLGGTERVLDIGCGNGKITAEIAARVPQGSVTGVDASASMIAYAKTHSGPKPNLQFAVADARNLPFIRKFDLVVSFNALHWIPEQELALRSIHSALEPGGIAQLRLVPKGERKSLEDVIEETRLSPRWAGDFEGFHDPYLHLTAEQYGELAERCGFKIGRRKVEDRTWDFETLAAFTAFGSVTFVEWTKHLPEEERPAFIRDVLTRYRRVAAERAGEENFFRFYQMDITLSS